MKIDANLLALIDQRIRMSTSREKASGACVTRDTTGPGADVLFDGSAVTMPVKVVGSVFLRPGDRCLLDRYGSEWVVTSSFAQLGLGEASTMQFGPPGGTSAMTSGTFVDLAEIDPITFDKAFDGTYVRIGLSAGAYCEGSPNTAVRFGLRLTPVEDNGTVAGDAALTHIYFNAVSTHLGAYHTVRYGPFDLNAGRYSVQVRWRRSTGSGSVKCDDQDLFAIELDEGVATAVPIL